MKQFSLFGRGLVSLLCLALIASTATAQETRSEKSRSEKKRDRSQVGKIDDKTTGANVRVSQMIGMGIQNAQAESVGKVNDIVLDASTGKVRYVAVTYGGLLGIGNKMFAVPYEAFKCHPDANDPDETVLVLNVTQKQLEGAVGFDEDHWPNFADTKFTSELDKRYGVDRQALRDRYRDRDVNVQVDRNGVDVEVEAKPAQPNRNK